MNKILTPLIIIVVTISLVMLFWPAEKQAKSIKLYAGGGLRTAVEKLVSSFESSSGIHVDVDYGGSGIILSRAQEDKCADLFLPGDAWYVDRLQQLSGNVNIKAVIAYFVPIIITAKGNPKGVQSLKDLIRPDIETGLGDSQACHIGRVSMQMFEKAGLLPNLKTRYSLTVNELGVWVKMRNVDAAIVWDAIAENISKDIQIVPIPVEQTIISEVVLASLKQSRNKEAAERFISYVMSNQGVEILKNNGYRVEKP